MCTCVCSFHSHTHTHTHTHEFSWSVPDTVRLNFHVARSQREAVDILVHLADQLVSMASQRTSGGGGGGNGEGDEYDEHLTPRDGRPVIGWAAFEGWLSCLESAARSVDCHVDDHQGADRLGECVGGVGVCHCSSLLFVVWILYIYIIYIYNIISSTT